MKEANSRKKKVLMIVPQADVHGGIAAVVNGYYGSRLTQDFDVTFVESYCDGSRFAKLKKAIAGYKSFRKILKAEKPDLIHIHSSFGPSFYRKLPFIVWGSRRKIPIVNHIHGSAFEEFYSGASSRKQKLVRRIYGKCTRTIVLSDAWKEKIGTIVPKDRIDCIRNYAEIHEECIQPEILGARKKQKEVIFLGVLTEGKGLYEMPAVIREVVKTEPNAHFTLCGVGDDEYLKQNIPADIFRSNVELPGWIRGAQKEEKLKRARVFWLPSHMEAMPMSALDAMGYALPCVSTNVGGIPAVIENGTSGVLTKVGDTKEMTKALLTYLTDDAQWEEASKESLRIAQEKFSLDAHIEHLEEVYTKAMSGKTIA